MLHEILFALLGKPGTIVRQDEKGLIIDKSLNLFKEQEITLLNQIINVGYHYSRLNQFLHSEIYQLFDYGSFAHREPSVYRQAVAGGLEKLL